MKRLTTKTLMFLLLAASGTSLLLPPDVLAQERGIENLRQTGLAFREVAKKVSPAVVFIRVEKKLKLSAAAIRSTPLLVTNFSAVSSANRPSNTAMLREGSPNINPWARGAVLSSLLTAIS